MEDKLKDVFDGYKPHLSDADDFIAGLDKSLKSIEALKDYREGCRRDSRRLILVAFLCGSLVGSALVAFMLLCPESLPALSWNLKLGTLSFTVRNIEYAFMVGVAVLLGASALYFAKQKLIREDL